MADLLTVEECARHIGIDDFSDDYTLIEDFIGGAKQAIETLTARSLATATSYTEYHDAGDTHVYVDRPPIVSVTTLYDSAWEKGSNSARSISSDDWIADTDDQGENYRQGKVELCNTEGEFSGGKRDVKVTYVGGWTTSTLPQDLREAWIELVALRYNSPERIGVSSESGAGVSASWDPNDIPPAQKQKIMRYSLRGID